jgi:PRTRC genetic system protein B
MSKSLPEELKAHQWALPEGLDVPPDVIKARLDFYRDSIIFYLLDKGVIYTKVVSAQDVTMALLQEVPMSSGLLPPNTLWWKQDREGAVVALWRSPRVWAVALQLEAFKPPKRFKLPMPGLIFLCSPGRPPSVYAAKRRPKDIKQVIYHAPLFNLFQDGRTCPGTHKFPANVSEIPESFFTSFFTREALSNGRSHKYPNDLLRLWEELDRQTKYPLNDLVPMGKVEDIQ